MMTRGVRRAAWLSTAVAATAWLASCEKPTAPSDPAAPVPGARTGPVAIEYAGANVAGTTITGCGSTIAGCAGRLRLTFRLRSAGAGPVLRTGATLHGANRIACLSAAGGAFQLAANAIVTIDLVFDQVNAACALPFESLDMAVHVEGTVEVASRQEFGVRYRFTP
jgi:hypothetical protein